MRPATQPNGLNAYDVTDRAGDHLQVHPVAAVLA
jgi:hypothetical protein